ncbi:hypothetical protein J4443_01115 [Candidatus Woesearchaeota archaeon]|nr:hypothetical protein [Candidatus Woesearchaeota archaeon]
MNELEILSRVIDSLVLLFVFTRVIGTECFSATDWGLTLIALVFSYFVRYASKKIKEKT